LVGGFCLMGSDRALANISPGAPIHGDSNVTLRKYKMPAVFG
jgi:hypothetical protein